jgi:hypothetical protein
MSVFCLFGNNHQANSLPVIAFNSASYMLTEALRFTSKCQDAVWDGICNLAVFPHTWPLTRTGGNGLFYLIKMSDISK